MWLQILTREQRGSSSARAILIDEDYDDDDDVYAFYDSCEKGCYIRVLREIRCDKWFWDALLGLDEYGCFSADVSF